MTPSPSTNSRGFTLIELLAVIAIIGVLAAILLSVLSSMRKATYQAKCLSNVRAIGLGIQNYVNDNRGRLPGPFATDQQNSSYKSNTNGTGFAGYDFGSVIGAYLDLTPPKPGNTIAVADILICPAWQAITGVRMENGVVATNSGYGYWTGCWRLNRRTCFGVASDTLNYPNRMLNQIENPAKTFLIKELDSVTATDPKVPPPVHGSTRNLLYADGHVGTQASTNKEWY